MSMPTNLPPVEPKFEVLTELQEEEDAILEPISLSKIISFHIEIYWYVSWHKSYTILVDQIQNATG